MFLPRRLFGVIASRTVKDKNGKALGIELTEAASQKLQNIEKKDGKLVRLEIDAGGCHGFQYNFQLLDSSVQLSSDDMYNIYLILCYRVFTEDQSGGRVIVDETSLRYLNGSRLTWKDTMMESGFIVEENPIAASGCSCGVSFDIDPNKKLV